MLYACMFFAGDNPHPVAYPAILGLLDLAHATIHAQAIVSPSTIPSAYAVPLDQQKNDILSTADLQHLSCISENPDSSQSDTALALTRSISHEKPTETYIAPERAPSDLHPFACTHPYCYFNGLHEKHLEKHQYTHNNESTKQCPQPRCPFKSSCRKSFQKHNFIYHPNVFSQQKNPIRKKMYTCKHLGCGFVTTASRHLKSHRETHGEDVLSCGHPQCLFKSTSPIALREHFIGEHCSAAVVYIKPIKRQRT